MDRIRRDRVLEGIGIAVAAGLVLFLFLLSNRVATLEGRVETFMQMQADVRSLHESLGKVRADVDALASPSQAIIISPAAGATVGREFAYKIAIRNPRQDKFYYLVNEISGLQWPKTRLQPPAEGGQVSGQSNEGGSPPHGMFYMSIIEVDQKEHARILRWFSGSNFPGLQIDGRQLTRVELVLR